MRKLIAALLLTSFVLPLHAQRSTVPPRYVSVPPEKGAQVNKSGDSRSFFQRMFGVRPKPTPTPKPTPAPTPRPVVKKRPKPTPAVTSPTSVAPGPATTVTPKTAKGAVKKGAPGSIDSAGLDDVTRFRNAKSKALEDPRIKELKSKADSEVNEAEAHKALMNYNRALFDKIREVDPSVSDYSGRVEQSMTKRIGSEKAK